MQGLIFIVARGLLTGSFSCCRARPLGAWGFSSCNTCAPQLWPSAPVVVAHGISSVACGILLTRDQPCSCTAGRLLSTVLAGKSSWIILTSSTEQQTRIFHKRQGWGKMLKLQDIFSFFCPHKFSTLGKLLWSFKRGFKISLTLLQSLHFHSSSLVCNIMLLLMCSVASSSPFSNHL